MSTSQSSGNEAMANLQSGWYNALVTGLNLDPQHFQTWQPMAPVGTTSAQLWELLNLIPPASLTAQYSAAGGNQFFSDYAAVVAQLQSQGQYRVRDALKDAYQPWVKYAATLDPSADLVQSFVRWAQIHYPDKVVPGRQALMAAALDPIYLAQEAVARYLGPPARTPDFTHTIDDLFDDLQHATAGTVAFDSSTASTDTSHTWASGEVSGAYDFFSASASGGYDKQSAQATSSHVTVSASFQRVFTFRAIPAGWYNSGAFGMAFHQPDNTVWVAGTPNWASTFGTAGNMQRFASSLVVVDGITITTTSDATYSTDDQTDIHAAASGGVWPFFSVSAQGGMSTQVTFDDQGHMTATTTSPAGNPAVLGVNVLTAADFLGGASV